jgi:hypothetical protein
MDERDESDCNGTQTSVMWFDTNSDVLTVNYEGMPGFLVCSKGWTTYHSDLVCEQNGCSSSLGTWYVQPRSLSQAKFLVLQTPDKLLLRPGSCHSYQVIRLHCQCNSDCGIQSGTRNVSWQWHAAIFSQFGFMCSGVVINRSWILTAAHCLAIVNRYLSAGYQTMNASDVSIIVGSAELWTNEGLQVHTDRIVLHPQFNRNDRSFDAALIHLTTPLPYSDSIRPICLSQPAEGFDGLSQCVAMGFAYTPLSGFSPNHELVSEEASLMTYEQCMNETSKFSLITFQNATMTCASLRPSSQDICFGESSNPLMCRARGGIAWTLVGLASWTMPNCRSTVYARAASVFHWVQQTVIQ